MHTVDNEDFFEPSQVPTHAELMALWNVCSKFIKDQEIGCAETIYQTDWVIENAYEFIERVCGVVGYLPYEDTE